MLGPLLLLMHSRQMGTLVNNAFLIGSIMECACQIGLHRVPSPEVLVWNMQPSPALSADRVIYAHVFWLTLAWHSQV
jgi:hypothetical protein